MDTPAPGQRWVSDTEPELGLGVVLKAAHGRIEIFFPAAGEHRQYALQAAPVRRVRFGPGDTFKDQQGGTHTVRSATEENGLLTYHATGGATIPEALLSDSISFSKPQDRLFAKQTDDSRAFDLRLRALEHRSRVRRSTARGFVGARMDLIPHQINIASQVTSRLRPRVLLADEVGLGKTIEACLILHRLHLTGRADRVLILVPDALLHQWFVELLRRFHLLFSLFDEERCKAIEDQQPGSNPFLDSQLVLTSLSFLEAHPQRIDQLADAGWNLLIVDEAHHLEWTADEPSIAYEIVETLAAQTDGLLLLSATPQQLGPEGHFARLRLLDPDRYADLNQFLEENRHYEDVAAAIDRLLETGKLSAADKKTFAQRSDRVQRHLKALSKGGDAARDALISDLIDEFGTGRVMFRNTRRVLTGFPQRQAHLVSLPQPKKSDEPAEALLVEALTTWLAEFLRAEPGEKILAICHSAERAEEIVSSLQEKINVHAALFHEGLTLMQRDRHAASFADEDGVRILVCSEIGSEGRNFQFAHHLVLLDLPGDAELLEQRIGRLDRIGQTSTIHIHIPTLKGSSEESLARWYHEGLNAFESTLHGASEIQRALAEDARLLLEAEKPPTAAKLKTLITRARKERDQVEAKLARGQDRLLELSSKPSPEVETLIDSIRKADEDRDFEAFFIELLDHLGLHIEELSERDYYLHRGHLISDAFPSLPEEGLASTFDRSRALSREQLAFLTPDHPLVRGAMDVLLGGESGNASYAVWQDAPVDALLVECVHVLECVAPAALHADRFLPLTPVRVLVNHNKNDLTDKVELDGAPLKRGKIDALIDQTQVKQVLLPRMIERNTRLADRRRETLIAEATATMETQLNEEIERLRDLEKINDHVSPEEITALEIQRDRLREVFQSAHLRLDAIRLVWCRAPKA
ncbi:MAG: RNA polymerase-associated protein RapA [Verrucomicrobiales bacterium]|nr:RNA polymerase-associated protein RapA [Verrucomicrobiales bacterium]